MAKEVKKVDSINERFKELRKECKKTQEEWASLLGISRAGICDIESGRRNVTDKHIKLLSVEPVDGKYINDEWLRTGDGEMFKPLTRSETIAKFAGELMKDEEDSFRRRLIELLSELNEDEWVLIENLAKKLAKKID